MKNGFDFSLMTNNLKDEIEQGKNDDINILVLFLGSLIYLKYNLEDFVVEEECIVFPEVVSVECNEICNRTIRDISK